MKTETGLCNFNITINNIELKKHVKTIALTRKKVFFHGITGKVSCFYHWMKFHRERKSISFFDWLDQAVAYSFESTESPTTKNQSDYIRKELEHFLVDDIEVK